MLLGYKVDMLWASCDGKSEEDLLIMEEKKELATKADLENDQLKNHNHRLHYLRSCLDNMCLDYIDQLECLTGLWHGLHLTILGTKVVEGVTVHFELLEEFVPKDITMMSQVAHYLLVVFCLKVIMHIPQTPGRKVYNLSGARGTLVLPVYVKSFDSSSIVVTGISLSKKEQ